jgi:hypothetical protein
VNTKKKNPNKWELIEESIDQEGKPLRFWANEDYGNIMESDGRFIAMVPKIIKLGPFSQLSDAQRAIVSNDYALQLMIENFNSSLVDLEGNVKQNDNLLTEEQKNLLDEPDRTKEA